MLSRKSSDDSVNGKRVNLRTVEDFTTTMGKNDGKRESEKLKKEKLFRQKITKSSQTTPFLMINTQVEGKDCPSVGTEVQKRIRKG